jgi:hypothetical protein
MSDLVHRDLVSEVLKSIMTTLVETKPLSRSFTLQQMFSVGLYYFTFLMKMDDKIIFVFLGVYFKYVVASPTHVNALVKELSLNFMLA